MEENIVRKILKNEITWLVMIIGGVSSFFTMVVLPLNNLHYQVAQLQTDVTEIAKYDERITQNSNDILVLKQQINEIFK